MKYLVLWHLQTLLKEKVKELQLEIKKIKSRIKIL